MLLTFYKLFSNSTQQYKNYDIYLTYFIESVFLLNVIIGNAKSLLIWLKKLSNETFLYMRDYFILMFFSL